MNSKMKKLSGFIGFAVLTTLVLASWSAPPKQANLDAIKSRSHVRVDAAVDANNGKQRFAALSPVNKIPRRKLGASSLPASEDEFGPLHEHRAGASRDHRAASAVEGVAAPPLEDAMPLESALSRITELESRLKELELKVPNKYPDVVFLNYKDRKRIMVTGGAGFVGSHLVDRLMLDGHEVVVVDNFFTGRKKNVEHWTGHKNFELLHHDIVNPVFIEVDQIYHLASPASPPHYMFNPVKTIKTNTVGSINVLGLAKRVGARVLIASTSEVYGDPEVHPQPETYWGHVNPIGPRACYDEAKRVSETLAYAYKQQEQVEVRVARIFNTYGPRMHMNDGRVVSNFILQALQGKDITVYGHGKQTRSFQYVTDLVDGLVRLMNSNYTLPVNLGNPDEHTIDEFASIILGMVGKGGGGSSRTDRVRHMDPVEDDPQRRRPDITRAKVQLGWQPLVPLSDGIKKTVDYFREEIIRSSSKSLMNQQTDPPSHNYIEKQPRRY